MTSNALSLVKTVLRYLLAIFFVFAGFMHFVRPGFYLRMMPPYLPWHLALVYLSGVAEALIGLMLMVPRFVRLGAWCAVALLIAVFPANIHAALHPETMPEFSPSGLLIRLPIQLPLIIWAWWYTRPSKS